MTDEEKSENFCPRVYIVQQVLDMSIFIIRLQFYQVQFTGKWCWSQWLILIISLSFPETQFYVVIICESKLFQHLKYLRNRII